MKNQNLDLIATVKVDIASPIISEASFGNLLIVGPLPAVSTTVAPALVGSYSSLKDVTDAGWVATGNNADPVGVAAMVAFSQSPAPSKIFIAPIQVVTEENEQVPEDVTDTVNRALDVDGWYALCTAGVAASDYDDIADLIETQEKVFCYTELAAISGSAITPSVSASHDRTFGIYGRETVDQLDANIPAVNKYLNVAMVAKILNYESGSETAAFKQLKVVKPSNLDTNAVNALKAANLNYFTTVGGKNITMEGRVCSGEWIDVIRFRDWLKNDMQVRVVNLFITNPKITLNDAGITLIQNQMLASLKAGQNAGGVAQDEYDADGNLIPGYTVTVPTSASLTDSQKASRSLDGFSFDARIAGAIHFAAIKGNLVYSM